MSTNKQSPLDFTDFYELSEHSTTTIQNSIDDIGSNISSEVAEYAEDIMKSVQASTDRLVKLISDLDARMNERLDKIEKTIAFLPPLGGAVFEDTEKNFEQRKRQRCEEHCEDAPK